MKLWDEDYYIMILLSSQLKNPDGLNSGHVLCYLRLNIVLKSAILLITEFKCFVNAFFKDNVVFS